MEVISMPSELRAELGKMRRNPEQFSVSGMATCRFCGGKTKRAHQLSGEKSEFVAGAWCPVHGWLHFDSVTYPPSERLSAAEIEDRRLAEQRQKDWQRRKAAKE